MPRNTPTKRTATNCSLPPEMAERLNAEAAERVLAPSKLIEMALAAMFERFDDKAAAEAQAPAAP